MGERARGWEQLWRVLVEPGRAFQALAERPVWLAPLLVLMVVNVGATFSVGRRVGWRAMLEKQFENNPRVAQMSPEQREQVLAQAARTAPLFGYLAGTVGTVVIVLVVAGALHGVLAVLWGASLRFAAAGSVVAYSFLPLAIKGLLAIVVLWLSPPETVDLTNLVASNAAVFVSPQGAAWLRTLLASFDLFTLWTLGLLVVGFSAVTRGTVPRRAVAGSVVGAWLVLVAARTALAAIFSS